MFEFNNGVVTFKNDDYSATFSLRKENLDLSELPSAMSCLRHIYDWRFLSDFQLHDSADAFSRLEHMATIFQNLNNFQEVQNLWCWTKVSNGSPAWMSFVEGGFVPICKNQVDNQWIMAKLLTPRENAFEIQKESNFLSIADNGNDAMIYVMEMDNNEVESLSSCPLLYQMFKNVKMIQLDTSNDGSNPFLKARTTSHLLRGIEGLEDFYGQLVLAIGQSDNELDMLIYIAAGFVPLIEYNRGDCNKDILMGKIVPRNR